MTNDQKCPCGPGYKTPLDAMKGPREEMLYTTVTHYNSDVHDYLATVDVNPDSSTFSKVIARTVFPHAGDEAHHTGWNACSSCFGDAKVNRSHLIVPCLNNRIYVVDTSTNPKEPTLHKTIEPAELLKLGVSFPHTTHCLADGNVMISTIGDAEDGGKGNFLLLDSKTFDVKGKWTKDDVAFGYDYWYQPAHNVMISTSWGAPRSIKKGFNLDDVMKKEYGNHLYVYNWAEKTLRQTIELDPTDGALPLEIRFKHDPMSNDAFVGAALGTCVFHIFRQENGEYGTKKVVDIPAKTVSNWALPVMPGLITDILVSLDDRFLFLSLWLHGDIRVYNIEDPNNVKQVGQCFIGGSITKEGSVVVTEDPEQPGVEKPVQPPARFVKGRKIEGAPQMLQLSLDGKRLYVTTSLYSVWDNQFYPDMVKKGGCMLQLDVADNGAISLNENFLVDFGKEPAGPGLPHEMRYPGGDVTSDIWLKDTASRL